MNDLSVELASDLQSMANAARTYWENAQKHGRRAVEDYRRAGSQLMKARKVCPHGQWGSFLKAAGIPQRTASNMMRIAKSGLSTEAIADMGGIATALRSPALQYVEKHGIKDINKATDHLRSLRDAIAEFVSAGEAYFLTLPDVDDLTAEESEAETKILRSMVLAGQSVITQNKKGQAYLLGHEELPIGGAA